MKEEQEEAWLDVLDHLWKSEGSSGDMYQRALKLYIAHQKCEALLEELT